MTTASALVLNGREIDPARLAAVCRRYGLAELVEIFGRPVDLLAKDSVHRLLRDEVLAEAKVL